MTVRNWSLVLPSAGVGIGCASRVVIWGASMKPMTAPDEDGTDADGQPVTQLAQVIDEAHGAVVGGRRRRGRRGR